MQKKTVGLPLSAVCFQIKRTWYFEHFFAFGRSSTRRYTRSSLANPKSVVPGVLAMGLPVTCLLTSTQTLCNITGCFAEVFFEKKTDYMLTDIDFASNDTPSSQVTRNTGKP